MRFTFSLVAACAASLIAAPAQAEVIALEENTFVTRDSTVVTADLRESWLALISPDKWWNSAHTFSGDAANMMLTPQGGGCFCEVIPAEDTADKVGLAGSVEHMTVLLSIPDQALRMRGSLGPLQSEPVDGIMTVTLAKVDEGTRITLEYAVAGYMRFETPTIAKAVDGVMSQQLSGLSKLLGPVEIIEEVTEEVVVPDAADAPVEDAKESVSEAFSDLEQEEASPSSE